MLKHFTIAAPRLTARIHVAAKAPLYSARVQLARSLSSTAYRMVSFNSLNIPVLTRKLTAREQATRTESDAFGPVEVETTRYWGAQTQRYIPRLLRETGERD